MPCVILTSWWVVMRNHTQSEIYSVPQHRASPRLPQFAGGIEYEKIKTATQRVKCAGMCESSTCSCLNFAAMLQLCAGTTHTHTHTHTLTFHTIISPRSSGSKHRECNINVKGGCTICGQSKCFLEYVLHWKWAKDCESEFEKILIVSFFF